MLLIRKKLLCRCSWLVLLLVHSHCFQPIRRQRCFRSPSLQNTEVPQAGDEQEIIQQPKDEMVPIESKLNTLIETLEETFDYDGRLPMKHKEFRCGFVSILGAPNMGKSTLLNALLQEALCIATPRPQTTRHAILGVVTTNDAQLCLIDTPGIIEDPSYRLQEGMMEAVMGAFRDADALLVVTDLFSTPIPDDNIFERVQRSKSPVVVVINKIDLVGKANRNTEALDGDDDEGEKTYTVPEAVAKWRSLLPEALAIVPLAASEGPDNAGVVVLRKLLLGCDDISDAIRALGRPVPGMFRPGVKFLTADDAKALLPQGPPLYDEEMLTDRPERFFASELIREALFETLKKELPYCCEVRIDEFKEPKTNDPKPMSRIKATVYVERESQKLIVIGKGGAQIKKVGTMAREKIEKFLQEKVYLALEVKVNKDWRKNDEQLKEFGYLNR
jgi:small GTP-binding protein